MPTQRSFFARNIRNKRLFVAVTLALWIGSALAIPRDNTHANPDLKLEAHKTLHPSSQGSGLPQLSKGDSIILSAKDQLRAGQMQELAELERQLIDLKTLPQHQWSPPQSRQYATLKTRIEPLRNTLYGSQPPDPQSVFITKGFIPANDGCVPTNHTITHSLSQTVLPGFGVSYVGETGSHNANSYVRAFDLATDFGITTDFDITSIDFGIQVADAANDDLQPLTVNLFQTCGAFPVSLSTLDLIGTTTINLPDQALTVVNIPVNGTVSVGATLIVEVSIPDATDIGDIFFPGANNLGQTGPTYLASRGFTDIPFDLADSFFPDSHDVMNVHGLTVCDQGTECTNPGRLLLVADTVNNRIQAFDGLDWTAPLMTLGSAVGQVRAPKSITQTSDGRVIYVADTGNNRIQKTLNGGCSWDVVALTGVLPATLRSPGGIAVKPNDPNLVYVSDTLASRILVSTNGGLNWMVLASAGSGPNQVRLPEGLAVDCSGNVYIADTGNNRIVLYRAAIPDAPAAGGIVIAGTGSGLNQVRAPKAVTVDAFSGDVYVADTGNNRITRFLGPCLGPVTSVTASVVCRSGSALGQVHSPGGVTIAQFGEKVVSGNSQLVIGDTLNNRIQHSDGLPATSFTLVTGTPVTQTGGIGSGVGQFRSPANVR
ncbi:MAG TPA: NHL repeat-containing protein [Acidobacteriota bacterium]|nr:NHL repeat-containing protein [Acidobacteriota bacterium]